MEYVTESRKEIGHNSPKPFKTKDIISEVKNMKQIRRNGTEMQSNSRQKMYKNDK